MVCKIPGVAAGLVVAVAGAVVPGVVTAGPASATAPACSGAEGVTVVVDYNELDEPTRAGCDPDGGGRAAWDVFEAAGFDLEPHPRQPGYVCKVTGLPADRPCLENDSFWSLWWSDGESGEWVFSSQGAGGLTVPDGGSVAFSWHEGGGSAQPPDHAPVRHEDPDPTTDDGTGNGNGNGNGGGNGSGAGGGGTTDGDGGGDQTTGATPTAVASSTATVPTSTASESARQDRRKGRRDAESPAESTTSSSITPAADEITEGPPPGDLGAETGDDDSALPTWIGLGVAVLVLGAAGLVTVLRRRAAG